MPLKSIDLVREESNYQDIGTDPETSFTPRQTDFRDNNWSEEILHTIQESNWILSNAVDETNGVDNTPDPDFDFQSSIVGSEYENDMDYFTGAFNEQYMDALKLRYHREQRNRESIERGGWSTMGWSFVGALLGPENLIPGTLAARGVKQGYSAFKSARNVGASGLAATTLSEIGLHESQGLRTTEESLLNVGMGTVFSAMFGAGLASFANKGIKSKLARTLDQAATYSQDFKAKLEGAAPEAHPELLDEAKAIVRQEKIDEVNRIAALSDEMKAKLDDVDDIEANIEQLYAEAKQLKRGSDLSAAAHAPTLDDLSIYGNAAGKYAESTKWFNPVLRTLHSPSSHARRVASNLFENPMIMKMNDYADSAAGLETKIKNWTEGRLANVIRKMGTTGGDGIYTEMRKAGISMRRSDFRKEIAKAMRHNDGNAMTADGQDTGSPSGEFNEYVVKAAKTARKELFEHAREELNKVGFRIDSKKSSTADSYLTRVWNSQKLLIGERAFKDRNGAVWNYIKGAIDNEIDSATRKYEKKVDNLNREIDELKLGKLRRSTEISERSGPTLDGELRKLEEIDERIRTLENELENTSNTNGLGDELNELFVRILPPQVRVQMSDEIENATGFRLQFAGEKAENADLGALSHAKDLEKSGKTSEQIWTDTGWYKAKDGKWRFEVDDSQATIKQDFNLGDEPSNLFSGTLGDFLDHPQLYEQYPFLREHPVDIGIGEFYGEGGAAETGKIAVNSIDGKGVKPILLHEIQHLIQEYEGFSLGTSPAHIELQNSIAINDLEQAIQKMNKSGTGHNLKPLLKSALKTLKQSKPLLKNGWFGPSEAGYSAYKNALGEVEARNVMARSELSKAERQATSPDKTIDVDQSDIITDGEIPTAQFEGYSKLKKVVDEFHAENNVDESHAFKFNVDNIVQGFGDGSIVSTSKKLAQVESDLRGAMKKAAKLADELENAPIDEKPSIQKYLNVAEKELQNAVHLHDLWGRIAKALPDSPEVTSSKFNISDLIETSADSRPRLLYQQGDNQPRAKSITDSLDRTSIEVPKEQFEWLGVKPGKVQADYTFLAKKRAKRNPGDDDPNKILTDPEQMKLHVENVLSDAVFAFEDRSGNWRLIARGRTDDIVALDISLVKGRKEYKAHQAFIFTPDQLERSIQAIYKDKGAEAFKWKEPIYAATPDISRQGKTSGHLGGAGALSVDDIIRISERSLYQERGAHPSVFSRTDKNTPQGAYSPQEQLILIARSAVNPEETLKHEAIHALKNLGLFKDEEWSLLAQSAEDFDWVKKHNILNRYEGQFKGDLDARYQSILEEAIAEEYSLWKNGETEVTPEVNSIFEAIRQFLGNIGEILKRSGIENYQDIFKMIDAGDIAKRGGERINVVDDIKKELDTLNNRKVTTEANIERLQNNETLPPNITPSDVQAMLDIVRSKDRPKMPETLKKFIARSGGLMDEGGELKNMGLSPKTHPKLVVGAKSAINEPNMFGKEWASGKARSFDDAGLIAWEEGFFDTRPTVAEFLDRLREDISGEPVVRRSDMEELSLYNDVLAVENELARLGIDPAKPRADFARTANEDEAINAVSRVLEKQADTKIAKLEKKLNDEEMRFNEKSFKHELDPDGHVDEIVNRVYNKLTNRDYSDKFEDENIFDFGFLKGKTFGIRDELIEEFLEDDIEHIMRRYTRNVAGQIEMKQRFGNLDLKNHFEAITDEYDALKEEVTLSDMSPPQKDKKLARLDKNEKGDIRDLKFARDKILGRYEHDLNSSGWARAVDAALSWQYMTSLGGVLLTSSLDAFRHPMTQGFGRIFGKQLPALIAGNKGLKMNREVARKYAGIAEIINNSRLAHMAGLNDPFSVNTPAEIAIQKMTDRFSKLTGLPYWNQFHKEFAGAVIIDRALESMVKGIDEVSPAEARWLRHMGLGEMATGAKRLQEEGVISKVQGVWTLDVDKAPQAVVDQFFAGIKKEIDTVIVDRGMGDAPLFTETPVGRIISQFKSFGAASNQRMLIRGMQDDVGSFVGGLTGMITAGMFVYMLKQLEAGREIDENPNTWLVEGMDRSGIFFLFFEANNIWEKAGGLGVYQAIGAKDPASRFASRNVVGAAMGPLFGTANDLLAVIGNGARALNPNAEFDPSPGDVKSARRLTPYVSLPYWRWLVDGYIVPTMQDEVR